MFQEYVLTLYLSKIVDELIVLITVVYSKSAKFKDTAMVENTPKRACLYFVCVGVFAEPAIRLCRTRLLFWQNLNNEQTS